MEGGCLGYPGASTVANQPLDRILSPWLANPCNPAMSPHYIPGTCHTDETVEGRKIRDGRDGEDAKATAPQTAAPMSNEELKNPSSVQSYHVPCEPALMGLTAGCPLSLWTIGLLSS